MYSDVRDHGTSASPSTHRDESTPSVARADPMSSFFTREAIITMNATAQPVFARIEANLAAVVEDRLTPELRHKLHILRGQFAAPRRGWQEVAENGR